MNNMGKRGKAGSFYVFMIFVIFFLSIDQAYAQRLNYHVHNNKAVETLVGTIKSLSRNTLQIYDEADQQVKRFVYFQHKDDDVSVGDRVRIYYDPQRVIQMIKKMTPVTYKPQTGNNYGFIMQKENK